MVFKGFTIKNSDGFHLRTAQVFSKAMRGFSAEVRINTGKETFNAKSVINLMSACIKCGDEITVICSGEDENETLSAAQEIIESGFGI